MRWAGVLLTCSSLLLTQGYAGPACQYVRIRPQRADRTLVFDDPSLPWKATLVRLSGRISIDARAGGRQCTIVTNSDATPELYGDEHTIAIRLVEITSDDVTFYDARSCKGLKRPATLHLGTNITKLKRDRMRVAGLCVEEHP